MVVGQFREPKSLIDWLQLLTYFLVPLFVPAAVVSPRFLGFALCFDGLGERFVPAEVVDPDCFLTASMNALFALMISSSLVNRLMINNRRRHGSTTNGAVI